MLVCLGWASATLATKMDVDEILVGQKRAWQSVEGLQGGRGKKES